MEAPPKSMAQKRARHYNETKAIFALSLIVFGVCLSFSLIVMWPQSLLVSVFNSRLIYKLMVDNEDYFTCDKEYVSFVVDEPASSFAMISFYVFNISNAYEVMERGDPPVVAETGPFAFVRNTYRYDIYFAANDSTSVTYKEFSYLSAVTNETDCEAMYYRLERNYAQEDACDGGACRCKGFDDLVTIVNPLFLKILWEDSPFDLLAHYAVEVFQTQRAYLDEPFAEAVQAQLVTKALKEIYQFRLNMHVGNILMTAFEYLSATYSLADITSWTSAPISDCGLSAFNIFACPFAPATSLAQTRNNSLPAAAYPDIAHLFNASNDFALTNATHGLPKWMGLAWYFGLIDFNSLVGYTMVNTTTMAQVNDEFVARLGYLHFGTYSLTADQQTATALVVKSTAVFLVRSYLSNYRFSPTTINNVYVEFNATHEPVICAPLGEMCVWQYGYLQHQANGNLFPLNSAIIRSMIDISTEVSTERNNFYKDLNSPRWYNAFIYYNHIMHNADEYPDLSCTNYGASIEDATFNQPAALYGSYRGINAVNTTVLKLMYEAASAAEKARYFDLTTNVSTLLFDVYRNSSTFHLYFTINYINKFKDIKLNHTFSVDALEELGIAQWGGGFITDALVSVRTTTQLIRNGMWRYGFNKYYLYHLEFAAAAVLQGFPHTFIYSVDDSRRLLNLLASNTLEGLEFRRHVMYVGSTLIGDGVHFVNKVGNVGEVAFTREANLGDFSCDGKSFAYECNLLAQFYPSSAEQCNEVQQLYLKCIDQVTLQEVGWIEQDNCALFETSTTSPDSGIQCDATNVRGESHPYTKSRGNVVFQMLYSLTTKIVLWDNLWCSVSYNNIMNGVNINNKCSYDKGGLFATTSLSKVLFSGYTEPSVVKYMDLKYKLLFNISFECVNYAYDICGIKQYACDEQGVRMILSNQTAPGVDFVMRYNQTAPDDYFAPFFRIANTNKMLWPYAANDTIALVSRNMIANVANNTMNNVFAGLTNTSDIQAWYEADYANISSIVQVRNFIWTAFPAWNDFQDGGYQMFLQKYQCQNRVLLGNVDQFASCEFTLNTGRNDYSQILQLQEYYGNRSIAPYFNVNHTLNFNSSIYRVSANSNHTLIQYPAKGSVANNQYIMYQYDGFAAYPYLYNQLSAGVDYYTLQGPVIFNKVFGLGMTLSQSDLVFQFEKDIALSVPLTTGPNVQETGYAPFVIPARRFTETLASWTSFRTSARPLDSYSMPYMVPIGMASLESLTNFPIFIETPNSYGNMLWGGVEYTHIAGTEQNENSQRTYVDYDPVTGRAIRSAIRQQVSIRVEANALLQNVFSSQQRCTPPSKAFAKSSGYGCFTYIPLFWMEEARIIDNATLFRYYDHYYTRPERGNVLTTAGIALGVLLIVLGGCFYISESHHSRRFYNRVYID